MFNKNYCILTVYSFIMSEPPNFLLSTKQPHKFWPVSGFSAIKNNLPTLKGKTPAT